VIHPTVTPKNLITYIAQHMARESALMYPNPQVYMMDPYGLLRLIQTEFGLTDEQIDQWMVEAQKGKRT